MEPTQPSAMEALRPLQDQVDGVVVHADMGAMHDLHDFAVDASGINTHLLPLVHPLPGGPGRKLERAFLLAELGIDGLGQIQGDFLLGATVVGDAVLLGQGGQLGLVLDFVAAAFPLRGQQQGMGQVTAVVGMGRRTAGDHSNEVAGHDDVGRGPADSLLGLLLLEGADAAGTHVAVAAAYPQFPETALGKHLFITVPDGFDTGLLGPVEHLMNRRINTLFQNLVDESHRFALLCNELCVSAHIVEDPE